MVTISINKNDILKSIYFITAIIQKQTSGSMQGALSSKGDLMGGIFDRWINTVPESIIFNKIILPEVRNGQSSEIISDFYLYDPKTAGIAPDVIGIRTPNGTIPFAVFNDRWIPVENMPQIEVKTFKKPQKMISLRNQDYDGKYLVMAESELRIDYLLPFFDASIFQDSIHSDLVMDDDTFIVSNSAGRLQGIDIVSINDDEIGTVTLLKITTAEAFMNSATFCEGTVSVQYINGVEKKTRVPAGASEGISLSKYCNRTGIGLYRFSDKWYEGYTAENIPYYTKNSRGGSSNAFLYRTLDFYVDDIDSVRIIKKSNSSMYIKTNKSVKLNEHQLQADSIYKVDFAMLDRSSNNGVEYFMQKSLITHIDDYQEQLKNSLEIIINGVK